MYSIMKSKPVAYLYYKGTHTHPVRRTVLLIENKSHYIRGYELREGSVIRKFSEAPIKSYRKDRIAYMTPYERRKKVVIHRLHTLERVDVMDLVVKGA